MPTPHEEAPTGSFAWQPMALVVVLVIATGFNLWWMYLHRRGLPLEIDEAGYLQRAVRDADALHAGGLTSLWSTVRLPDPQAPLLTVVAGVFRWVSGGGIYRLLAVEQLFYVVAVVSTYLASRRLMNRNWSLLTAVLVATLPGIVNSSRVFWFAVPATAMVTATLAAQLHSDAFRSRRLSLLWGLLLGLSALSRTVVLALLPSLVVAAVVTVVLSRPPRRKQAVHLGMGLGVSLVVAGSWYSATWHQVLRYLTQYGYGVEATHSGSGRSVFSLGWWLFRINNVVNIELYAPLALALVLCFVAGLVTWVGHRRAGWEPGERGRVGWVADVAVRSLRRPDAPVWFLLLGGYFVLSTSSQHGSLFELPLVPALCVLAVSAAGRSLPFVRRYLAAICLMAAALSFVSKRISAGPVNLVVFDGRGMLLRNAYQDEDAYLRSWLAPSQKMATFLHGYAETQACDPVVFFGVQDPLFNTNTVDLDYQLTFGSSLPTGLLRTRGEAGETPYQQLEDPALGIPNLVITGPVASSDRGFSPLAAQGVEVSALIRAGFAPAGHLRLPDARLMTVWWTHRGPCGPGRP
jgi:4-amino-4-deoxy-L-arabinose transferase-like glycosyltransferase